MDTIKAFQAKKQPAISVDTKKKELVGDFKNGGRELRPKGDPELVRVHDFRSRSLARPCPMASTISPPMPAGSAWGSIMTPQPLPSRASGGGGTNLASRAIHT